jgi:hypothetical protein
MKNMGVMDFLVCYIGCSISIGISRCIGISCCIGISYGIGLAQGIIIGATMQNLSLLA